MKSLKVWISPTNIGNLEKPERLEYSNIPDSSKLYGYEMSSGEVMAIWGAILTGSATAAGAIAVVT